MARLTKRERQQRRAGVQRLTQRRTVALNLAGPYQPKPIAMPSTSHPDALGAKASRFHYPFAKLGSDRLGTVTRVVATKQSTGIVGKRLTKRRHRKVINRFVWKGSYQ